MGRSAGFGSVSAIVNDREPRAPSGCPRWRGRAGARSPGWLLRAGGGGQPRRQAPPRAWSDRRRAPGPARPGIGRRGRCRAGARPRLPRHRARRSAGPLPPRPRRRRSRPVHRSASRVARPSCRSPPIRPLSRALRARIAGVRIPGPALRCAGPSIIPVNAFCGFVAISSRAPSTYAQKFAPQFRPDCVDSTPFRAISPPPRAGGSFVCETRRDRVRKIPLRQLALRRPRQEQRRGVPALPARQGRPMISRAQHDRMANAIRALAMDAVETAKSGHPGLPMGAADEATVLFTRFLKFDPADPAWPDRDRFVLSAGHGSMLIYAVLHLLGYPGMTLDEIKRFRQLDSKTPGHPENFITEGVENTTGPLGQGLANAVGMALAERLMAAQFGEEIVDHFTYVLASDGDLMEGVSQEAIALAGHLKLGKLIVLFDDNGISIDGKLSLSDSTDQVARVKASGWNAVRIDGHDPKAIAQAIAQAQNSDRPTLIAARTTIGYGAPKKAGTEQAHGSPLGGDEIKGARGKLGWSHGPFQGHGD